LPRLAAFFCFLAGLDLGFGVSILNEPNNFSWSLRGLALSRARHEFAMGCLLKHLRAKIASSSVPSVSFALLLPLLPPYLTALCQLFCTGLHP
jgi:predicted acyltransferase